MGLIKKTASRLKDAAENGVGAVSGLVGEVRNRGVGGIARDIAAVQLDLGPVREPRAESPVEQRFREARERDARERR